MVTLNAVLRNDNGAVFPLLLLSRGPGEVITADLDVVVGELSVLIVIHAEKLGLGRGTEVKTGNHIDSLSDDSRNDKGVSGAGDDVGDLDIELAPVVVEETTGDLHVDTIETDNVVGGEEAVENESDDATDGVFSEHIESVVNSNIELDFGAKVASDASNDTENDAGPGSDDTGSGSSSNETRDSTRAPADERPLLGKAVIEKAPSHSGEHGSQAGVPAGHGSTKVSTEGRATVETEPAEPEEYGADGDERNVVGAKVEHHLLVAATKDPGVSESRHSGADFDGTAASIVKHTILESPAIGAPSPISDGAVNECGPEEDENHSRDDATTLGSGSDHECGGDGTELHL